MPVEQLEIGRQLRKPPNRVPAPTLNCPSIERSWFAAPRRRQVANQHHKAKHSPPMPCQATPVLQWIAAAAPIATAAAASVRAGWRRDSWGRRDTFHCRESSLYRVLIKQL